MTEIVNLTRLARQQQHLNAANLPWLATLAKQAGVCTVCVDVHAYVQTLDAVCITLIIDEAPIAAFNVGGEPRVCVPQLVAGLLGDIDLHTINSALIALNVHTQLADKQQLIALKYQNILQPGA
jgi:hypothetical protein